MEWYDALDLVLDKGFKATGIRRILLVGPPGTGKTTYPTRMVKDSIVIQDTVHEDDTPDRLFGTYTLNNGNMEFQPGLAIKAWTEGHHLVINEITNGSPSLQTILHAVADDPEVAQMTLPDGKIVRPNENFVLWATTNHEPETLDEALLDRFDLVLMATIPHPGIFARLATDRSRNVLRKKYLANLEKWSWSRPLTARTLMNFEKLSTVFDPKVAHDLTWGTGDEAPSLATLVD